MKTGSDGRVWLLFDLDGTLADTTHRVHLAEQKAWDDFNAQCHLDPAHPAECAILRGFRDQRDSPYRVAICTGRSEAARPQTERWLRLHHLRYDDLMMRPLGDHRPDTELKKSLALVAHPERRYLFVLEDRDKVVAMWRAEGLTCLQCRPGTY